MKLYIVRHGESRGNIGIEVSPDPELTVKGKIQAELLGERLAGTKLDCIITSPLIRAVQTAREIAIRQAKSNAEIEILPDLYEEETEVGYSGRSYKELCNTYKYLTKPSVPTVIGGSGIAEKETRADTYERAKKIIEYIKIRFDGDYAVMLVAHGSFNNYLISAALGFDVRADFNFSQDNTCLNLINYLKNDKNENHTKAVFINDISHLKKGL